MTHTLESAALRIISHEEAIILREKIARHDRWIDSIRGKDGRACYKPEDVPSWLEIANNNERSALEVYDFVNNPPDKYYLYVNAENKTVTTWTGEVLGRVVFGCSYRSNWGDKRIPITVLGINGRRYHGTYYTDSEDCARIKAFKS